MKELELYQQTDAYKNFVARQKALKKGEHLVLIVFHLVLIQVRNKEQTCSNFLVSDSVK